MDKLEHIFELQKGFQDKLRVERGLNFSQEEWIQKQTLAMISELAELLEEVNFKWWKNPHELNQANIREELSDILHFFISMCLEAGMTADTSWQIDGETVSDFIARQDGTSQKHGYETGLHS